MFIKWKKGSSLLGAAVALIGCVSPSGSEKRTSDRRDESMARTTQTAGALCDFAPTNGERLGVIYRVPRGSSRRELMINLWDAFDQSSRRSLFVREARTALARNEGSYTNNLEGDVLLEMLGIGAPGGSVEGWSEVEYSVDIILDGTYLDELGEVGIEEEILPALGTTVLQWFAGRRKDSSSNYYIVTGLVKATSVRYSISRDVDRLFGAEGEFTQKARVEGGFEVSGVGATTYTLERDFGGEAFTVCHKLAKLTPEGVSTDESDDRPSYRLEKVENYDDL